MRILRMLLAGSLVLPLFLGAQAKNQSATPPAFRINSQLVFLDVTVLDKQGNPVLDSLTKQDFTITDNKKPQRIFSFEAPNAHQLAAAKPPSTILVLDRLNSSFSDFAFILEAAQSYLQRQPAQLPSPTELLLVDNRSLDMLVSYTQDRDELLDALRHIPGALPWKLMNGAFYYERFLQSIEALQEIALQNNGVEGRKLLVWIGHGAPGIDSNLLAPFVVDKFKDYIHHTANLMVDNRMSLYLIYPGLGAGSVYLVQGPMDSMRATKDLGNKDPFIGDINFSIFVNETGGRLYYNRNDVNREILEAQQLGSDYYTLTYQPGNIPWNGRFHRIRVSVRNPALRVVTKTGYFAPKKGDSIDPANQIYMNLAEAARSTVPYTRLAVHLISVVRHPDAKTVELVLRLEPNHLTWHGQADGRHLASVTLAAASLNNQKKFLSSVLRGLGIDGPVKNWERARIVAFHVTVRLPSNARAVRVVLADDENLAMGSVDVTRKEIDAAPEEPTPEPNLLVPVGNPATSAKPSPGPPAVQ